MNPFEIIIKFKQLHKSAKLPTRNHDTDTGYDLYSVENKPIKANSSSEVDCGLQVAFIQPGWWFRIEPRSGLGFKYSLQPHLGIIDSSYRGYLSVKLYNFSDEDYQVQVGDKIAQIVIYPIYSAGIEWTEDIHETVRGEKGLGSSGR